MIDTALNAAILTAVNALQAEANLPTTMSIRALAGACQSVNATCRGFPLEAIMAEMEHILKPGPIVAAGSPPGTIEWGYSQATLEALS